jgi:hypothetical protein
MMEDRAQGENGSGLVGDHSPPHSPRPRPARGRDNRGRYLADPGTRAEKLKRRGLRPQARPKICEACGGIFFPQQRQRWERVKVCNRACAAVLSSLRMRRRHAAGEFSGEKHPRWTGGISQDNGRYARRHREKYPEHVRARLMVRTAIASGKLKRQPCEQCGAPNAHGHHDDYSKPLDVRWLCPPCHAAHHGHGVGRAARAA